MTSKRTGIRGQKIMDPNIMDPGFSGGSFLSVLYGSTFSALDRAATCARVTGAKRVVTRAAASEMPREVGRIFQ